MNRFTYSLIGVLAVISLDQITKYFVLRYQVFPVFRNSGISFSIDFSFISEIVIIIPLIFLLAMYLLRELRRYQSWWIVIAFSGMIGGALGNLIDRIRTGGYVIDFIAIHIFPVFNIADVCITIGVVALLIAYYIEERTHTAIKKE